MIRPIRKKWRATSFWVLFFLMLASTAQGQEVLPTPVLQSQNQPPAPPAPPAQDELRDRIERLEKQNQQLLEALQKIQQTPPQAPALPVSMQKETPEAKPMDFKTDVRSIISDYMKEEAKKKSETEAEKKKKEEADGYTVGSNMDFKGKWKHGPWFETADKAYTFHLGGRAQYDVVGVQAPSNVEYGTGGLATFGNSGGTRRFDDGSNFRRARLTAEGTIHETMNYCFEFDFINSTQALATGASTEGVASGTGARGTFNTPVPTDLWLEWTKIPFVGNLRVGNFKPPVGLEHYTSSRFLNFMERSIGFDAFIEDGDNGFAPGAMLYNWSEDERFTVALAAIKTTRAIFGWNVGDGEWGAVGRTGYLLCYEDHGRKLMWVGVSGYFRDLDDHVVRFRGRTELRNGPASLHNIAVISQLNADHQSLVNPEFSYQNGPVLINAEYTGTWVDNVKSVNSASLRPASAAFKKGSTYFAQAAYVEGLYFLTGEHRDFNKKLPGYGRVIPYRNAFWVNGENGNIFSTGAWQVGARYSWVDLNNDGIRGGAVHSCTLGLNWFFNPNAKWQLNYEVATREVEGGTASGTYQGVGMRFAFDW